MDDILKIDYFSVIMLFTRKFSNLILFGIGACIFQACSADYATNMVHSPALRQQGDLQIGGGVGHLALNGQGAYAVSDNIGIMINGKRNNSTYSSDYTTSHSELFVEAGAGYFNWWTTNTFFELYAGYGLGEVHNVQTLQQLDITYLLSRSFIQPAVGMQADFFTMSLAARFAQANLRSENAQLAGAFIEPAITAKVRFDNLSAVYQMGAVRTLYTPTPEMVIVPFWISLGFEYHFDFKEKD